MKLSKLRRNERFKRFLTADIETRDYEFVLMGVFDGESYRCFHDFGEAISFLRGLPGRLVFAHNLKFDGIFIMEQCSKMGIETPFIDSSGKLLELKLSCGERVQSDKKYGARRYSSYVRLHDSYALFPLSQEELAKAFSVDAKKYYADFPSSDAFFKRLESIPLGEAMPEYEKRNEADCIGLFQILSKAQEFSMREWGVDIASCMTAAQLAMRVYRANYLKKNLWNPLLEGSYKDLRLKPEWSYIMEGYAGGRCEAFDLMEHMEPVYEYDVRSMYPFCMLGPLPVGDCRVLDDVSADRLLKLVFEDDLEGFADVTFSGVPEGIPRTWKKIDGKLMFVNFLHSRSVVPFPELRYAAMNGLWIDKVHRVVLFREKAPMLAEMMSELYSKRLAFKKAGNSGMAFLCKLVSNSTYGKFAQRPERDSIKIYPGALMDEALRNKVPNLMDNGSCFYSVSKEYKPSIFSFPHWSAYITSYARIRLHSLLSEANSPPDYWPIYCDTDSVFVNERVLDGNVHDRLGGLDLKHSHYDFKVTMPKVYQGTDCRTGERFIKAKGFPRRKLAGMVDAGELRSKGVEYDTLLSPRSSVRSVSGLVKHDGLVKVRRSTRLLRKEYDKREVLEDGSTLPWILRGEVLVAAGPGSARLYEVLGRPFVV